MAIVDYQYRVDGGAPVSAGLDFTEDVTGLAVQSYDFEMRSEGPVGVFSAWSPIISATPLPGWTPDDLLNIAHRWKAKSIVGLSNTDPVSTWEDLIGSADFTGVTTTRPLYYTNSGDPYVEFDGVDDKMVGTIGNLTDYILISVWERVSTIQGYARFLQSSGTGILICQDSNTNGQLHFPNAATALSRTTAAPPTGFMSMLAERIGSAGRFRIDGSETTGTIDTAATGTALNLAHNAGGDEYANIRIKELILMDGDFDTGEEALLTTYISDEYGLTM